MDNLFLVKYGKSIIETTDKLSGDAFWCVPERNLTKSLGTIFGVLELKDQPDNFSEAFYEIISDLKTEYYLPPFDLQSGVEKRFEECIQRANRRILKAMEDSIEEINLHGINALIGLSFKNSIIIAYAGEIKALLIHLRKDGQNIAIDIIGDENRTIKPEKLFSNLSNGKISGRDKIFILSSSTSNFISSPDLINIVESNSVNLASEIDNLLQSQAQKNNFYTLTIEPDHDRIDNIHESAKKTEEHSTPLTSINSLIKTQRKTEKFLTPSSMPSWQKIFILILKGIKKIGIFLYPILKKLIIFLFAKIKILFLLIIKKKNKNEINSSTSNTPPIATNSPYEQYDGKYPTQFNQPGFLGAISNWLNKQIFKIISLKRTHKIILLLVFIMLFAFSESIVLMEKGSQPKPLKENQNITNKIEDKINLAEAQNIFSDEAGAKALIQEAQALLGTIPNKKNNYSLIEMLQSKINETKMAIEKISSIDNPQILFDLNEIGKSLNFGSVMLSGQNLIASANNSGVFQIDLSQKQVKPIELNSDIDVSKLEQINERKFLLLDKTKGVYSFTEKGELINLIPGTQINDINYYGDNVYTLDKGKGIITKYQIKDGKALGGIQSLKNGDLNQTVSFAVNGDFFLFKENGEIKRYRRGQLTDTIYKPTDPVLSQPVQLYSSKNDYLYILDTIGNKVVIYDSLGNIKVQITSPKFTSLKSMAVSEKEQKIYLLSDNKIFIINTGI